MVYYLRDVACSSTLWRAFFVIVFCVWIELLFLYAFRFYLAQLFAKS
jgi:hypothetical protein